MRPSGEARLTVLPRTRAGRWVSLAAGVLLAVAIAPVAVAVVMLRCCDDAQGPTVGAWVVMAAILLALLLAGAAVAALLARLIERLLDRGRRP